MGDILKLKQAQIICLHGKYFWGQYLHIEVLVNFPIWLPYFLGVQVKRSQETIKDYCISLKNQIACWSSEV